MIIEGLVTTIDANGQPNLSPMGPSVDHEVFDRFLLRPFPTSQTCQNLSRHGEGVFHITDDVLLMARAAIATVDIRASVRRADSIAGFVLIDCCRFFEFRASSMDESGDRVKINADVVHSGRVRDFLGFNRAKHAVIEAAILATRITLLPPADIRQDLERFRVIVKKTGGQAEIDAFGLLDEYVRGAGI